MPCALFEGYKLFYFTSSINHGQGGRHYLRVNSDGSKTFYLNGMDFKIDAESNVTTSIRIHAKGYSPVAQVDITNGSDPEYTYFVQDHLGSPVVTVGDDGAITKQNRYDAWGQMTDATGVAPVPTDEDEKNRTYTGHEMMAKFNMGQWNGRIFDYEIGAFPQADKFIQGRSTAALNRYALGQHQNPNVIDSSGWTSLSPALVRRRQEIREIMQRIRRESAAKIIQRNVRGHLTRRSIVRSHQLTNLGYHSNGRLVLENTPIRQGFNMSASVDIGAAQENVVFFGARSGYDISSLTSRLGWVERQGSHFKTRAELRNRQYTRDHGFPLSWPDRLNPSLQGSAEQHIEVGFGLSRTGDNSFGIIWHSILMGDEARPEIREPIIRAISEHTHMEYSGEIVRVPR